MVPRVIAECRGVIAGLTRNPIVPRRHCEEGASRDVAIHVTGLMGVTGLMNDGRMISAPTRNTIMPPMKAKRKIDPARNVIKDIDGERWVVRKTRPTEHGFTIELGVRESEIGIKERIMSSVILTPALANYIRAHPKIKKGARQVVSVALYRAFIQRVCPRPQVTDAKGRVWEVLEEKPTKHGFSLFYGMLCSSKVARRKTIILTPELMAFMKAHREEERPLSEIGFLHSSKILHNLARRAKIDFALAKVKGVDGVTYAVRTREPTEHGFELLRGHPVSRKRYQLPQIIPTKALIDHLRAYPSSTKARLPISAAHCAKLIRRFRLLQEIKDFEGKKWFVRRERATPHGFSLFFGCQEGTTTSLIPTRDLVNYLRSYFKLGGAITHLDLSIKRARVRKLTDRLGIVRGNYTGQRGLGASKKR